MSEEFDPDIQNSPIASALGRRHYNSYSKSMSFNFWCHDLRSETSNLIELYLEDGNPKHTSQDQTNVETTRSLRSAYIHAIAVPTNSAPIRRFRSLR